MRKIADKSAQIGATVPIEDAEMLEQFAVENSTSVAWHLRKAVREYIERRWPLFEESSEKSN